MAACTRSGSARSAPPAWGQAAASQRSRLRRERCALRSGTSMRRASAALGCLLAMCRRRQPRSSEDRSLKLPFLVLRMTSPGRAPLIIAGRGGPGWSQFLVQVPEGTHRPKPRIAQRRKQSEIIGFFRAVVRSLSKPSQVSGGLGLMTRLRVRPPVLLHSATPAEQMPFRWGRCRACRRRCRSGR